MKKDKSVRVRHPKYGSGFVYLIGEDCVGVAFLLGLKRVPFPITAMRDGTLIMKDEARAQFQQEYNQFTEWVQKEKLSRQAAEQERPIQERGI